LSLLEQVTNYGTLQSIYNDFLRNLQFTPTWASLRPYGLIKLGKLLRKADAPSLKRENGVMIMAISLSYPKFVGDLGFNLKATCFVILGHISLAWLRK
jgi:hypothetical protein